MIAPSFGSSVGVSKRVVIAVRFAFCSRKPQLSVGGGIACATALSTEAYLEEKEITTRSNKGQIFDRLIQPNVTCVFPNIWRFQGCDRDRERRSVIRELRGAKSTYRPMSYSMMGIAALASLFLMPKKAQPGTPKSFKSIVTCFHVSWFKSVTAYRGSSASISALSQQQTHRDTKKLKIPEEVRR